MKQTNVKHIKKSVLETIPFAKSQELIEIFPSKNTVQYVMMSSNEKSQSLDTEKHIRIHDFAVCDIFLFLHGVTGNVSLNIDMGKNARVSCHTFIWSNHAHQTKIKQVFRFSDEKSTGFFHVYAFSFDQSNVLADGNIQIQREAQKTDSQLHMQGYLFSKTSSISLIPQLQIVANDVKASHGASTQSVSEQELFYLQSRGLSKKEAVSLFVEGVAHQVIEKIRDKKTKKTMESKINELIDEMTYE